MDSVAEARPLWERWRRSLLALGMGVTVLGVLHHVDHVVRGNHSGWPFQEEVSPFTFSLLIYALLVPGLYLTLRRRLLAGYWLFTAVVLFAVVTVAHFVGAEREAPIRDIYAVYASPAWCFLALLDLAAIYVSLAILAGAAIVVIRRGKRGPI